MRVALSGRQNREYLKKADEVIVEYRDHNFIYDLVEINPKAIITLYIPNTDEEINWKRFEQYKVICKNGFRIMATRATDLFEAKERGFQFFSALPVYDGYQLNAFINLGVCAARIAGQLAHQLDFLEEKTDIEIRAIVNSPNTILGYRPLTGSWYRPEDIKDLPQIDVIEFDARDNRQEQALYRIYVERKEWPGRLNEIINDIEDDDIMNRMIPPEFTERRANCRMSCMNGGSCHYCERVADVAKIEFIREVKLGRGENVE